VYEKCLRADRDSGASGRTEGVMKIIMVPALIGVEAGEAETGEFERAFKMIARAKQQLAPQPPKKG
jgi:hypothetical protein